MLPYCRVVRPVDGARLQPMLLEYETTAFSVVLSDFVVIITTPNAALVP